MSSATPNALISLLIYLLVHSKGFMSIRAMKLRAFKSVTVGGKAVVVVVALCFCSAAMFCLNGFWRPEENKNTMEPPEMPLYAIGYAIMV